VVGVLMAASACSSSGVDQASSTVAPGTTQPTPTDPIATPSTTTTTAPTTTAEPTITEAATTTEAAPQPAHVVVIMLENTSYDQTFGPDSPAPYLSTELPAKGALLTQFYGVAHVSLGNYIAQISGQAPSKATQLDCSTYTEFVQTGEGDDGQVLGDGCVYPAAVKTIGDQLKAEGLTWKAYGEDMAGSSTEPKTCRHPEIGAADTTFGPQPGNQYATRHMPFVYFHSIIDGPDCDANVVDLSALDADLASADSTANLTYIVPSVCNDGHDHPCVDGAPGGLISADEFLKTWVPKVLAAPAFQDNGLLVVTFDEADIGGDSTGCCGDLPSPNLEGPVGLNGPGGGRVGAVLIGTAIGPGTVVDTPYNHYSLLCSMEELWGLDKLGYAGNSATPCFGADVYSA
jgi:phosphatidylinositol-3-phosphatase